MNRKFECREAQGCARATVPVISVSEHCGGYGLRPLPILQFLPWTKAYVSLHPGYNIRFGLARNLPFIAMTNPTPGVVVYGDKRPSPVIPCY